MDQENTRIRRIHFIEYNAKINTLGSLGVVFPKYGTTLLATLLKDKGYDVQVFLEGTSAMDERRMFDCDLVCFPVYAPILTKVKSCAERIRREYPDLPIVTGGPHVCFYPETVVSFCDYAIRCEGDEVLPEIIKRLDNRTEVEQIKGISFQKNNGEIVHNPEPDPPEVPDTIPDITLIEGIDHRMKKGVLGKKRIINTIQTSRGCRFRCKFCPTRRLFQGVYRNRDIDSVISDFKRRKELNNVFFVVDNDFCSDKKKTKKLLQRLIAEDLDLRLTIFERHEIGQDFQMLELLKKAGVEVIIVGVESLLDESLKVYNKRQRKDDVLRSIQNIRDHGMHVLTTFVLGGDGDTQATATALIDFIKTSQLSLNLFILHDPEGDESKGLIIPLNRRFKTYWEKTVPDDVTHWDYFTGSFVTYFPKRMKPSTLQKAVLDINSEVFSHENILRNVLSPNAFQSSFGIFFGYGMKRINDNIRKIVESSYIVYLQHLEEGLYDENEVLIEERLELIDRLPFPAPLPEIVDTNSYEAIRLIGSLPGIARLLFRQVYTHTRALRRV